MREFVKDLIAFTLKEARAALFAGIFLLLLVVSNYIHIPGLYRYDFLFLAAMIVQVVMIYFKLETKDEAKTILLFHILGLVLEIYKTNPLIGSWSYPEPGLFKLFGVPLYSGFMYASIGSYIAASWKVLKQRLINPPNYTLSVVLCLLVYINFFTNHFYHDMRVVLIPMVLLLYWKTKVAFTPREREYKMPLALGFVLVAFFVWIAENIGTFYGAWKYPTQLVTWHAVSTQKITSWFLMVIISYIIVAYLKHVKEDRAKRS
jgi:uncharacterized membrane protein YoaT (DUF817 family)